MITEQEFKRCLPASLKAGIDDTVRQQFNACLSDPNIRDIMGQNLIGYTSVLQQGKFKLSSYISAVRYCTYTQETGVPTSKDRKRRVSQLKTGSKLAPPPPYYSTHVLNGLQDTHQH